ncbi:hypothetical protein TRFO_36816 [Tritrichomonas foetus]|uniref:Uncharacterized protein n=1 Tax=Tritrichomonas foetus TaxID=1144522 RepID=A0A1J4JEE9_9EUKA|nr:hypothetical protein TRFO_36816 [Tritrichomonas foetus]|eukprot:OHS97033.1 hypothetical protein TRFO_36816 [Tritrichomonas foetus]
MFLQYSNISIQSFDIYFCSLSSSSMNQLTKERVLSEIDKTAFDQKAMLNESFDNLDNLISILEEIENEDEKLKNILLLNNTDIVPTIRNSMGKILFHENQFLQYDKMRILSSQIEFSDAMGFVSNMLAPIRIKSMNFEDSIKMYENLKYGITEIELCKECLFSYKPKLNNIDVIQESVEVHLRNIIKIIRDFIYCLEEKSPTRILFNQYFNQFIQEIASFFQKQTNLLIFSSFFDELDEYGNVSLIIKYQIIQKMIGKEICSIPSNKQISIYIIEFKKKYNIVRSSMSKKFNFEIPSSFEEGMNYLFNNSALCYIANAIRKFGDQNNYKEFFKEACELPKYFDFSNQVKIHVIDQLLKESELKINDFYEPLTKSTCSMNYSTFIINEINGFYHFIWDDLDHEINSLNPNRENISKYNEFVFTSCNKMINGLNGIKINQHHRTSSICVFNSYSMLINIVDNFKKSHISYFGKLPITINDLKIQKDLLHHFINAQRVKKLLFSNLNLNKEDKRVHIVRKTFNYFEKLNNNLQCDVITEYSKKLIKYIVKIVVRDVKHNSRDFFQKKANKNVRSLFAIVLENTETILGKDIFNENVQHRIRLIFNKFATFIEFPSSISMNDLMSSVDVSEKVFLSKNLTIIMTM